MSSKDCVSRDTAGALTPGDGQPNLMVPPDTVTFFSGSDAVAGPVMTEPSLMEYELPWQGQWIAPAVTLDTRQPWWVHTALKPL